MKSLALRTTQREEYALQRPNPCQRPEYLPTSRHCCHHLTLKLSEQPRSHGRKSAVMRLFEIRWHCVRGSSCSDDGCGQRSVRRHAPLATAGWLRAHDVKFSGERMDRNHPNDFSQDRAKDTAICISRVRSEYQVGRGGHKTGKFWRLKLQGCVGTGGPPALPFGCRRQHANSSKQLESLAFQRRLQLTHTTPVMPGSACIALLYARVWIEVQILSE